MPSGLKRFQKAESLYFITFSCYRRRAACTLPSGAALGQNVWAQYNGTTNGTANNQMSATSINPNQGQPGGYDMAGDVLSDGLNQYLYDGEGRICASKETVDGTTVMTGYVYDADGARVAKGSITSWSCDPSVNGVATAGNETDYILGPGGEQVTELAEDANGSMNWQRTYVHGAGALIATYSPSANSPNQPLPSFRLTDWLGTMRATTDSAGVWQGSCTGLPFGDQANCQGNIPDPRHFTGKERDTESGNDYFGARYYASAMGRWLSPDSSTIEILWSVPYADLSNPQSLNLYAYGANNPLRFRDLDGHWHQECQSVPGTSSSDGNGNYRVDANEHCISVADFWDWHFWENPGRNAAHQTQRVWHNAVNFAHSPRGKLFIHSLEKLGVGGVKASEAVAGVALAPETGGLSLALTVYGGIGAGGDLGAGTGGLLASIFASDADISNASQATDFVADLTTVSGATALIAGGSVNTANHVAAAEDIVVTAGTAGFTGDAPKVGDWLGLSADTEDLSGSDSQ